MAESRLGDSVVDPADIELPPTKPIDITSLIDHPSDPT